MSIEETIRQFIGDVAYDNLTEDEQRQLCTGDSTWIEQLVEARQVLPLPQVPPLLSQNLRDLFDSQRLVERHAAVLVSDSRRDRRLVGVRGAGDSTGWSYTYSCEAADIVLDVWPQRSGVDLEIQVMTQASQALAYRAIARPANAATSGRASVESESDEVGQIRLADLEPISYDLSLSNLRSELTLRVDLAGAAS